MAKKKDAEMLGPLYTPPRKNSLGAQEVSGEKAKSVPDPLKFNKTK